MREFAEHIGQFYDRRIQRTLFDRVFYADSGFLNFGYWRPDTVDAREACENLMEELLGFLPEKRGKILDVACGNGATTRYLCKYYEPADVVGINVAKAQLQKCRENAPGCTFLEMDATSMDFPDSSFDNVICVEAAFHFDTREKFLAEAYRVLKDGGRLLLTDILFPNGFSRQPQANVAVKDADDYEAMCRRAKFIDVDVLDTTEECLHGMFAYAGRIARQRLPWLAARPELMYRFVRNLERDWRDRSYVLASCAKSRAPSAKAKRGRRG